MAEKVTSLEVYADKNRWLQEHGVNKSNSIVHALPYMCSKTKMTCLYQPFCPSAGTVHLSAYWKEAYAANSNLKGTDGIWSSGAFVTIMKT